MTTQDNSYAQACKNLSDFGQRLADLGVRTDGELSPEQIHELSEQYGFQYRANERDTGWGLATDLINAGLKKGCDAIRVAHEAKHEVDCQSFFEPHLDCTCQHVWEEELERNGFTKSYSGDRWVSEDNRLLIQQHGDGGNRWHLLNREGCRITKFERKLSSILDVVRVLSLPE